MRSFFRVPLALFVVTAACAPAATTTTEVVVPPPTSAPQQAESPPPPAATAPPDVDGVNLTMSKIEADVLVLEDLTCKVDGGLASGLLGGLALVAGMKTRKTQLDACSPSAIETRVKWVSAGGRMTHVRAGGASARVNECVERALTGAPSPADATCAATVHHGRH